MKKFREVADSILSGLVLPSVIKDILIQNILGAQEQAYKAALQEAARACETFTYDEHMAIITEWGNMSMRDAMAYKIRQLAEGVGDGTLGKRDG